MNKYDYRALLRFKHTGNISENSVVTSSVTSIGNDEAMQIHKIEIIPPDNGGTIENMFVRLIIDGNQYPFVYLHSTAREVILGDHKSTNPLENTCPKAKKSIAVQVIGGPGGVTQDFEVRIWGDYFKGDDSLKNFFGATMFNNVPVTATDPFRDKVISVHHPVSLTISNFASLPGGGVSADKPNVLPMVIYNMNSKATTPNVEYYLTDNNVRDVQFPMFWNLDASEAVILERIGVDAGANGKYAGIKVANDYYPDSRFDVSIDYNEIPLNHDTVTVESLNDVIRAVIINNELGGLFVQDNGTSIAPENALVGMKGKFIYLK